MAPAGPVLVVLEVVYSITDPPMKALRRFIPPLRLGGVVIDLSFVALLLICYILLSLNRALLARPRYSRRTGRRVHPLSCLAHSSATAFDD